MPEAKKPTPEGEKPVDKGRRSFLGKIGALLGIAAVPSVVKGCAEAECHCPEGQDCILVEGPEGCETCKCVPEGCEGCEGPPEGCEGCEGPPEGCEGCEGPPEGCEGCEGPPEGCEGWT